LKEKKTKNFLIVI